MEVAENTFLLLVFLLPGFFFSLLLHQGVFERTTLKRSAIEETSAIVGAACFFHAICIILVYKLSSHWEINFRCFLHFFRESNADAVPISRDVIIGTSTYHLYVFSMSGLCGWYLRKFTLEYKWHRYRKLFRWANPWWYILTGEVVFFKENTTKYTGIKSIDTIYVDVLVRMTSTIVIYQGVIVDHFLKDGALETISIRGVKRRTLNDQIDIREKFGDKTIFYELPGSHLTIFAKDIINLNMTYFDAKTTADEIIKLNREKKNKITS